MMRVHGGAGTMLTRQTTTRATAAANARAAADAAATAADARAAQGAAFPGQGMQLGQAQQFQPPPPPNPPLPPRARRERGRPARDRRNNRPRQRQNNRRGNGPPAGDPGGNPDGDPDGNPDGNQGGNPAGRPAGDPGGDPPPGNAGGGGPPPDDGDDGDDDPGPEGFFRRRALPNPQGVILSPEQRDICRVWWLAQVVPDAFVPLIVQGGYGTWQDIAIQTSTSWKSVQSRMHRWNVQGLFLTDPAIQRLTALSRWILCRIIHGAETNVDSLDRAAVDNLVMTEVCEFETDSDVTPPTLDKVTGYISWYKKFEHYLKTLRNKEGVPLYYVIRDDAQRPSQYQDLMDELMWKLPHDTDLASYHRDNQRLYALIHTLTNHNHIVSAWFKANGADATQDGRKGFLSIRRCCVGNDAKDDRRVACKRLLRDAKWTGYGQGRASTTLISDIFNIYTELSDLGKNFSELEKMEEFTSNFFPKQDMVGSTCYKAMYDKGKEFIRLLERNERYDRDGCPLTFAEYTSFVIDEERFWIKQVNAKRGVSQAFTTIDEPNDNSSTRQGADTDPDTNSCSNDDSCTDNESCSDDTGSVE